ncbi:serine/threonine-protein kinase [Actinomadura xylanilytica]|uniref:serine/threonine-protein kinase n=1 Tax=Actinomadura xylanilytica TaxID=887459 RepID=UPI00255AEC40|nr:serine/threonine protein kinase [Actinomadura xylanilytica]MDL4773771.1 protein kinase [Actinomadura xylanilytica]
MTSQNTEGWSTAASNVRPLEPDDPTSVGEQRLLGRLGEGGMGVVYLGLGLSGRKVAVKVIHRELARDREFRARFDTEVASAQSVASFCTAQVLDHGEEDGLPYLVTEYIDGPSLNEYVEAHGGFPPGALRSLAVGVATALTAIHALRLVHRDLKPHNVLLAADGPRVIDFGIARALDSENPHTRTGVVMGSPGYIAPEMAFEGQVGTAADVFAWGTLVAYAATGRHPFGTGTLPVLANRAQQAEYDLSGVPQDLLPMIQVALDPDPARRPAAEALLVRLVGDKDQEGAASDLIHNEWRPGPVTPAAESRTIPRPSKRRTWGVAGAAAGVTALVMLGAASAVVYTLGRGSDGDRSQEPLAAVSSPTATPTPRPSLPTPSTTPRTSKKSGKASAKPARKPSAKPSATPTITVTRPTKRWRELGGLHRMATYCKGLGYKETVTFSEGGRNWWCTDSGGGPHRIDMQANCRWHYQRFSKVRAGQRPTSGRYEVDWFCEALV